MTKTNTKVLTAEAEVEQARTAYMFCGQGSQKKDMGMALYEVDDAAKSIWDRGDRYLFNLYGKNSSPEPFSGAGH
jgi:(acyl-carrier-protein) S-malonyltransferase